MRSFLGVTLASFLTAATVSAYNETVKTVTVTSWSTLDLCSAPVTTTVTLCDAQCATPTSNTAANVVYQTLSEYQPGQIITMSGAITTLAQPTTLTFEETVSNLVLAPSAAANNDYTASVIIDSTIYPSSITAYSGEVVTCQTRVTTISSNGVVLTNCPCIVQSTILEVTATGIDVLPTAVVSSPNYIVKIIYVYIMEYITDSIPTRVTSTATSTLTTIQTETATQTATDIATATTSSTARPTMATVDRVVFLLDYDTTVDGSVAGNSLRKRQAGSLPGISVNLYACLSQCTAEQDCVALTFDESSSLCRPLVQFDAGSSRIAPGVVFAKVIFRPAVPSSARTSSPSSVSLSSRSTSSLASTGSSLVISSAVRSGSSVIKSSDSQILRPTRSSSPSSSSTVMTSSSVSGSGPASSIPISISSNKSGSKSVLYPISNSSTISTSSSLSSTSSSSVSVSLTDSSIVPTGSTSSSTFSSGSSLRSTSSTVLAESNSSSMITSSNMRTSASATLPASNSSISITTSSVPLTIPTDGCSLDNPALDLFTDEAYVSEADAFCSSYLEIPAVTETAYSTFTAYRVTNVTTTLTLSSTVTEQLPDATITDVSTEIDVETVSATTTSYVDTNFNFEPRDAAQVLPTVAAMPFASRVATISAPLVSAGCSCIQSKIPISTTTSTLTQQLTLSGLNTTATSIVQELYTVQTQSTTLETSVITTTSTTTALSVFETCTPSGGFCDSNRPDICCSGGCFAPGNGNCGDGDKNWCCM